MRLLFPFQILRIVVIVLHALQLFLWNDCEYSMVYPYIVLVNAPFFAALTISDHLLGDNKQKNYEIKFPEENS